MNNSLRIIAILSLACIAAITMPCASAQGVHYNDVARTADNTPLNNGLVAVCSANPTTPGNVGQPCAPLATIYTDAAIATPATNPINADIHGNFSFWAAPGTYFIEFYSPLRATAPFTETITLGCVPNTNAAGCGSGNSVSVISFGAKCDDATDDTAAIQAAVNSLPTSGASVGGIISFPGVCKTTSSINITTPDVTFEGIGHFQFITQNPPPSYIDFQGTTPQNAINVNAQGFAMDNMGVKYPTTIGGPLAPPSAPTLSQVAASGCPAEAYFVEATYTSAQGQTVDSPEATITTTTGNCLQVASPAPETGATGWNVFVSSNSNNETKQTASPLAIGTNWTFAGTLVNLGFRPAVDTTAFSAIFDPNGAQLDGVKLFTNLALTAGTASTANGYTSFGCCGKLHNVYVAGFGFGILGSGANNDFSVVDSYVQSNYAGAFIVNGADINVERTDFEGNVVGNLKMLYGSPYKISGNYFEQQGTNPPSYQVQIGDTTIPPQGFTPTPGAITIDNNFMQCNLTIYPPAPIVVETSQVLNIERNSFSQCEDEKIVDDLAPSGTAHITMLGNISDAQPLSWLTSTTGMVESDVESIGTGENPGTPYFYGLGIDSQSGPSSLAFNNAGASAWNVTASPTAFSFANNGTTAWKAAPFGSGTKPDVLNNFATAAAEVIVTQSGASATFDASLGNMFELIMSANVTSATLVNTQPGQWLDFIICQGGGGPWTFAWPSNVFGGGTVGTTIGPCSTQQFYVSGSNAWAAGPMTVNLTSGSAGPSLLGVAGTVPYFTGTWTNGDCLQAGSSPGLITLASGACGTGTSTGTSVSVNGGATLSSANLGSTPAAGANNLNVTWQLSGSAVSAELPVFGASGASHSLGLVPDPGSTAGSTRFLREDGTWDVPAGGSGSPGGTNQAIQFNNSGSFGGDATNLWWNDSTDTLGIGSATAAHWVFTPTSAMCVQADGVTPCVPSLQGGQGSNGVAGTGMLGFNTGTDYLAHWGINGEDLGPITVSRQWNGSTANTYLSDAPLHALVKGDSFCGDPLVTNTGASTLNVNALGALSITKFGGVPLGPGDIIGGVTACIDYNGSAFTLRNPQSGTLSGKLTTTAATSDSLTITGLNSSSICAFSAANASAATNLTTSFISAVAANSLTLTHTATAGMIYNFVCVQN